MAKFENVRSSILEARERFSKDPDVKWDVEPFKTVDAILMTVANDCEFVEIWPVGQTSAYLASAETGSRPAPKKGARPAKKSTKPAAKKAGKPAAKKAPAGSRKSTKKAATGRSRK